MGDPKAASAVTAMLVILGIACFVTPALTQQPDTAAQAESLKTLSIEQLMNVEVTSVSKRPERLSRVASAIQVITQQDIRRSGASNLPEALRLATNLQVAQIDSRQWAISARGLNSTAANKLLVLIDGRVVYTPLFSGVFWDVQDVPISEIDRIEVISGPGATLWGANAVNGVINVITKDAKDTQGLLVSGGGGSELRGFGSAQYGGALGSEVHYRAYGSGFTRQPTLLPTGGDATDDWHFGQGGFRVDWDPSQLNHATLHGDLYDGRASQPGANDIALNGGNLAAKWSHTMSANSDVRAQLYYDGTHRDIPGTFSENLDTYDVDLQHHARLGTRHDLVWGLGYLLINDRVANSAALAFLPAHVKRQWFTGFVQDEIALEDRVHLTLGTKIEHNDYTGFEIQPGGRVNWTVSPSGTLWAAVSRALRTPSRIDREFFAPGQPPFFLAGGPNFVSEEELAYEVGYRHQRGPLALSLATFYSRYYGLRSLEQANPSAAFPIVIGNGQDAESYGAELSGDYRVSDRWRLVAGYTELRIHVWALPTSTDTSHGSAENHTPDRQFSLRSSADLPGRVSLDGTLRYVGAIVNDEVPAYAELDVRLGWQPVPGLELSVVGQNLLHDQHAEFGTPTARSEIKRGVYGSLEWHF
ncbi:MAG TPA: TonB-dependent receptor [Gemmatimonadales bacterium]|nr:TonB-dependent receptor [Gemmatimonadales bacterium]